MLEIGQLTTEQIPEVREMMREYLEWAFTLDESGSDAPTFKGFDDELKDLPGVFGPPSGRFLVAELDGSICGSVAMKRIDNTTCELKRLYVRPKARGHNVGLQLVNRLVTEAQAADYQSMILDSHRSMESAHAVYRKAGFRDVEPYPGFPEDLIDKVVFMARDLS